MVAQGPYSYFILGTGGDDFSYLRGENSGLKHFCEHIINF